MIRKGKSSMEKILFCMTLVYLREKFYKNLNNGRLDISMEYMQWNSDVIYAKQIIEFHTVGYRL